MLCERIVFEIEHFMKQGMVAADILKTLNDQCNKESTILQQPCQQILQSQFEGIYNTLKGSFASFSFVEALHNLQMANMR